MVWDSPKALRPELKPLAPSGCLPGLTFAGDMLATQPNGVNEPAVCGNCFAVNATSVADVIERLRAHRFYQEVSPFPGLFCPDWIRCNRSSGNLGC